MTVSIATWSSIPDRSPTYALVAGVDLVIVSTITMLAFFMEDVYIVGSRYIRLDGYSVVSRALCLLIFSTNQDTNRDKS